MVFANGMTMGLLMAHKDNDSICAVSAEHGHKFNRWLVKMGVIKSVGVIQSIGVTKSVYNSDIK